MVIIVLTTARWKTIFAILRHARNIVLYTYTHASAKYETGCNGERDKGRTGATYLAKRSCDPRPPSVQSLSKQSALANYDIYTYICTGTHIHVFSKRFAPQCKNIQELKRVTLISRSALQIHQESASLSASVSASDELNRGGLKP